MIAFHLFIVNFMSIPELQEHRTKASRYDGSGVILFLIEVQFFCSLINCHNSFFKNGIIVLSHLGEIFQALRVTLVKVLSYFEQSVLSLDTYNLLLFLLGQ